jgi:hypothetical protein
MRNFFKKTSNNSGSRLLEESARDSKHSSDAARKEETPLFKSILDSFKRTGFTSQTTIASNSEINLQQPSQIEILKLQIIEIKEQAAIELENIKKKSK